MENEQAINIDLLKLAKYIIKRAWLPMLCFLVGFALLFGYTAFLRTDTYTAYATMYVYNGNPNVTNYQYTNSSDLDSAVKLLDTYMVVIQSNKVMDAVAERLGGQYSAKYLASTLSMSSVSETGVMKVMCTTTDPQLSATICNAVMDIAPTEILRVVSAGSIEVIDYADVPYLPNDRSPITKGIVGGVIGVLAACAVLFVMFMMNRKITELSDVTDEIRIPVLAMVPMRKRSSLSNYLIDERTPIRYIEGYSQLRLNLNYALGEEKNLVLISSSIPDEGKSTISANLAISCSMDGKHVLLIDGDMRNATQDTLFELEDPQNGLSTMLLAQSKWEDVVRRDVRPGLDIIPTGKMTNTPAELLNSPLMRGFLKEVCQKYDLVIIDTPPINVVTDALVLSDIAAGLILVIRQDYSNIREVKQSMNSAKMTGMNMLGMVYYGSPYSKNSYGYSKYYSSYYTRYDHAKRQAAKAAARQRREDRMEGKV